MRNTFVILFSKVSGTVTKAYVPVKDIPSLLKDGQTVVYRIETGQVAVLLEGEVLVWQDPQEEDYVNKK